MKRQTCEKRDKDEVRERGNVEKKENETKRKSVIVVFFGTNVFFFLN